MNFKEFSSASEKFFYLKVHYFKDPVPKMTDNMICLCCQKSFRVQDFKVEVTTCDCCGEYMELIRCPNAPDCEGDLTDWMGIEMLN